MNTPIKTYVVLLSGIVLCFFVQGCDQVKKFIDYLSPNTNIQSVQSPQQVPSQVPIEEANEENQAAPQEELTQKPSSKEMAPNVLARVGDWSMTIEEFNRRIESVKGMVEGFDPANVDHKRQVLSEVLQQQLLFQEALRRNIDKKEDVVQILKDVQASVIVQAFLTEEAEKISVTDEEVKSFYDQNPKEFMFPLQWRVSEIVVSSEDDAKQILVELNQGIPFDTLAKDRSVAKSAEKNGDLGFLYAIPETGNSEDLPVFPFKKMEQIVSALDVGTSSGSFSGPEGFYIVKLSERRGGEIQKFEEVQADLKNYLLAVKQQNELLDLLAEAQNHLEININEKLLEE
ncbi:MAG: peptidyl-prolyl cis-trans isomerase [Candidatus Omnitrophota bacterium]